MGVCALSLPSAIMLWAEGSWRLTYKILLIKMQSILRVTFPVSWRYYLFTQGAVPSGVVSKTEQQSIYFQVPLHLGLQLE